MPLYFAYGSNMNPDQIKACFGDELGEPLFIGSLENHRLTFTRYSERQGGGVADIETVDSETVWGVAFEVSDAILDKLDKLEGAKLDPPAYRRISKKVRVHGKDANPITRP
jgi:Gamma-glutamyl cyclotransferase, AIG2-like